MGRDTTHACTRTYTHHTYPHAHRTRTRTRTRAHSHTHAHTHAHTQKGVQNTLVRKKRYKTHSTYATRAVHGHVALQVCGDAIAAL